MTYRQKQILSVAAIVVIVGASVYAWIRRPANNDNFPNGTWWICRNADCKHEFALTMAQLSDHHERHYGQPVPCPKCKGPADRADKCPSCGKVYRMQRDSTTCPACGKAAPAP